MKTRSKMTGVIIILIMFGAIKAFAQQANFSGKWAIDSQKGDLGKVPRFVIFDNAAITQTKDEIELTTIFLDKDGNASPPATTKYSLNGNPNERLFQDTLKVVGSCKFSDDKKTLVKDLTYTSTNNPGQPLKTVRETWSLSDDGKELSVERNFKSFNQTEESYTDKSSLR
jgi:hypothetical protein